MINKFLAQSYYGNTIWQYIIAALILVIGFFVIQITKYFVSKHILKLNESEEKARKFKLDNINKYLMPFLYLSVLYLSIESLRLPINIDKIINNGFIIVTTWYVIRFTSQLVKYILSGFIDKTDNEGDKKKIKALTSLINVIVYVIGLSFLLNNLGVNITAIVAGLGIGGIAVALAAQAVLGDLFSYFVIFFDRPFEIGDFITVDTKSGTIEKIGIKSTKIRGLTGELIIISNSNLTNSRVHNFKALKKRRVAFNIGVKYETKLEQLKIIPTLVENIISSFEKAEFDRCSLNNFGDFSLNYEIVFFYESSDYKEYMAAQNGINLAIIEEFEKQKIEFAYPTQTLFLNKEEKIN
ncbi:MAG: mechanosensitive ion channel family protein [bacterium]